MEIDELIKYLTELRKEVGNVKVTICKEGEEDKEISEIYIDTDIDCIPYIVIEYKSNVWAK